MKPHLLVAAGLLLSCGDASVDGTYRGEPLLTLEGSVLVDSGDASDDELATALGTLRVALFWSRHAGQQTDGPAVSVVEQQVLTSAAFPAQYALSIFRPPPEPVLVDSPDGRGRYAVALVLAYVDSDDDGRWSPGIDRLVGGAREAAVLYTPDGASSAYFGERAAGFHRVRVQAGSDPCFAAPHATLHSDGEPTLTLRLEPTNPATALLDIDCDGHHREWDVCPAPERLTEACTAATPPADVAWQCRTCPVAGRPACPDVVNGDAAACLAAADDCFTEGEPQARCLGCFDACQAGEPGTFATCGAYGDVCLELRGDDTGACQDHFVMCAVAPG